MSGVACFITSIIPAEAVIICGEHNDCISDKIHLQLVKLKQPETGFTMHSFIPTHLQPVSIEE
jgi:hypothetical protein